MSNFFEKELEHIMRYSLFSKSTTYVGRAALVRLNKDLRAKIAFSTTCVSNQYTTLLVKIINRVEGEVDRVAIRIGDHTDYRQHIWDDHGHMEWAYGAPTEYEYKLMSKSIDDYLTVFQ